MKNDLIVYVNDFFDVLNSIEQIKILTKIYLKSCDIQCRPYNN